MILRGNFILGDEGGDRVNLSEYEQVREFKKLNHVTSGGDIIYGGRNGMRLRYYIDDSGNISRKKYSDKTFNQETTSLHLPVKSIHKIFRDERLISLTLFQSGQCLEVSDRYPDGKLLDIPFIDSIHESYNGRIYAIDKQRHLQLIETIGETSLSDIIVENVRHLTQSIGPMVVLTHEGELIIIDEETLRIVKRVTLAFQVKTLCDSLLASTDGKIYSIRNLISDGESGCTKEVDYNIEQIEEIRNNICTIDSIGNLRYHPTLINGAIITCEGNYKRFIKYPQLAIIEDINGKLFTIPRLTPIDWPYKLLNPIENIKPKRLKSAK